MQRRQLRLWQQSAAQVVVRSVTTKAKRPAPLGIGLARVFSMSWDFRLRTRSELKEWLSRRLEQSLPESVAMKSDQLLSRGCCFGRSERRARMRSTNRSGRVQATGGENSVTSVPQQPDIIPLKEVEKQAILVAVKRLGVQGAAIALGVGKTTISSETTGMATRPPRVGIGMADCSNNKTEYITQRGSKGNRISQMVSGYDGTASRRAVGCSHSGASGRGG